MSIEKKKQKKTSIFLAILLCWHSKFYFGRLENV